MNNIDISDIYSLIRKKDLNLLYIFFKNNIKTKKDKQQLIKYIGSNHFLFKMSKVGLTPEWEHSYMEEFLHRKKILFDFFSTEEQLQLINFDTDIKLLRPIGHPFIEPWGEVNLNDTIGASSCLQLLMLMLVKNNFNAILDLQFKIPEILSKKEHYLPIYYNNNKNYISHYSNNKKYTFCHALIVNYTQDIINFCLNLMLPTEMNINKIEQFKATLLTSMLTTKSFNYQPLVSEIELKIDSYIKHITYEKLQPLLITKAKKNTVKI